MKQFFLSSVLFFILLQLALATLTPAQIKAIAPAKDECLLWFGKPPGDYKDMNEFLDTQYIKNNGGVSLGTMLAKAEVTIPAGRHPTFWNDVSRVFAAQASGKVRIIQGALEAGRSYKTTIFYTDELPQLTKPESKVTEIVSVNAEDPSIKRVVWTKEGGKHWGKGGADEDSTPKEMFDVPTLGCTALRRRGLGAACPVPASRKTSTPTKPKTPAKTDGKATKPVTKPATKPTTKPAPKPTPKPATKPVAKPGKAAPARPPASNAKVAKPPKQAKGRKQRRSGPSRLVARMSSDMK